MTLGFLIVGPYCLITTAVSTDLGTHQSLRGNAKALATVVAIIDGTGSLGNFFKIYFSLYMSKPLCVSFTNLGAAIGPCIVGLIVDFGWFYVFVMLIVFLFIAILVSNLSVYFLKKNHSCFFQTILKRATRWCESKFLIQIRNLFCGIKA